MMYVTLLLGRLNWPGLIRWTVEVDSCWTVRSSGSPLAGGSAREDTSADMIPHVCVRCIV